MLIIYQLREHLEATDDIMVEILSDEEIGRMLVDDNMKQALIAAAHWKYFALKNKK